VATIKKSGLQVLGLGAVLMLRLVNATFINGYDGWSFPMLGKSHPSSNLGTPLQTNRRWGRF
jgi:hypothetical protein